MREFMVAPAQGFSVDSYTEILSEFLHDHSEEALYHASLLSQALVESGLGPEDIVALHAETLTRLLAGFAPREQVRAVSDAHQFLLEVMIGYGVHYKRYLELRVQENLQDLEGKVEWEHERVLEAERVGREKAEILSVIAHELRQPLTAAQAHIQLAQQYILRGDEAKVPAQLLNARAALDRLSRLSGDLAEASRGDSPQLTFSQIDLGKLMEQVSLWVAPSADEKDIVVHSEPVAAGLAMDGNADALLSIMGNLLSNAVRYTLPGGQVSVRTDLQDDWIAISVSDTGIGMSPEVQERIFEKFYRAPGAQEVEGRGLGLGLTLVDQLVRAHNGRIEVESKPGHGSTFRVLLPTRQEPLSGGKG
jgi:signal transduction histidine kinase